jgi:rubrerythrin
MSVAILRHAAYYAVPVEDATGTRVFAYDSHAFPFKVAVAASPEIARRLVELLNEHERVRWRYSCPVCGTVSMFIGERPVQCPCCGVAGDISMVEGVQHG